MGKTVVITGGAGFLGSHLCKAELRRGNTVICIDNLYSSNGSNIHALNGNPNFTFINADVCEPLSLPYRVDMIYNLACPASPYWYAKEPVRTMMTSVLGMKNMLDLANVHHARVLFTSTSEVYGDPLVHPQHEEYSGNVNITGVRSCYDEGKRAAETLCADYRRKYCTDVVVTRLFNTYGPSMASNDGRVVSNFITQALDNKDITIYGDGSQTRSFCYVDDMVLILQSLMHRDELLPLPINVGNPEEYTIKEIAYLVQSMTMSGSKVVCKQLPEDDPKVRKPDTSRLCSIIGEVEYTPLNIGLQNTVDYFKSVIENAIHS